MKSARRAVAAALVSTAALLAIAPAARAEPQRIIAVLEFRNKLSGADKQEIDVSYLTDQVRTSALDTAPSLKIITRENLLVLLQASGKKMEECEGECEVDTGRRVGADYVISGDVLKFGSHYKLNMRLHDTHEGKLLQGAVAQGKNADELDANTAAAVRKLLAPVATQAAQDPERSLAAAPSRPKEPARDPAGSREVTTARETPPARDREPVQPGTQGASTSLLALDARLTIGVSALSYTPAGAVAQQTDSEAHVGLGGSAGFRLGKGFALIGFLDFLVPRTSSGVLLQIGPAVRLDKVIPLVVDLGLGYATYASSSTTTGGSSSGGYCLAAHATYPLAGAFGVSALLSYMNVSNVAITNLDVGIGLTY